MGQIALLAALLIGGYLLYGRLRRSGQARYLDTYPYEQRLDRRLAARRPEWTSAQRQLVLQGLREYFHLCRLARRRMVAMPSQAVDDAWHEFTLFTRHYQAFCRRAFGRFLHHTPAQAMRSPTQASDGLKRAWHLACRREGIDPLKPARLPLLFALDAQLGLADGFIYRLDCLAAGRGQPGDYCASHIGCSGATGCGGDSGGSESSHGNSHSSSHGHSHGDGGSDSGGDGGGGCGGD
ncbi:hypothetical protein AZSI13_33670 [Azospira sp. I13]|uniref:glycine-rich domain-containing protein n=1 Tax=Azospira sp. I13 TaxID=1765050 RepID=UPI000D489197|nr:hypothetical protein [Azospira sp. I13]GBG04040.1 hypothetical protein AZSI13_33670 [Azospira sp. I13]